MESFRALVTGGLGLIGSSVVSNLQKKGSEVVIVDDGSAYTGNLFEKLSEQMGEKSSLIKIGTENPKLLNILEGERFDFIFNFGSYSSDRYFERDDIDAINKTINGMINILKVARSTKAGRVVYPSSGTVYGKTGAPQFEETLLDPLTPYSITKVYLEMLSKINDDISTVGLRIFTGYGAREWYKGNISSVVTLFTTAALKNRPIEIYGDGNQRRDFIDSDDIAEIAVRLATADTSPRIVNCGSGYSNSFNELVDLISRNVEMEVNVKYVDSKVKFVPETRANVDRLLKFTGFKPAELSNRFGQYLKELRTFMEE